MTPTPTLTAVERFEQGEKLLFNENYESAVGELQSSLVSEELDPKRRQEALAGLGQAQLNLGNNQAAIETFEELLAISDGAEGKTFFSGFARVINTMRRCPKLIIGRIHGKAVGGGVGLAAACDYCYATERASIRLSELAIGIGPFVIAPAIERKMGLAALTRLSLEPTHWQTAYWAQEKGLFGRVFETVEELDTEVGLLASKLAGYNPKALVEMKRLFWEGTDHWDELLDNRAAISGRLVMSTASKEVLKKFK